MQPPPSRLTLGTVQFGANYGVANQSGRPSFATVCEILREAHQGGVNTLDTASAYGESEECIGRALRELGLRDRLRVVTKVAPLAPDLSPQEAGRQIEASVMQSLKRLGLEQIPLCLFHRENNLPYTDELLALRSKGLIGAVGVSLVDPASGWKALKRPELKAWQIPSNLLDQRYTHSDLAAAAQQAGVTVFVRSVYLQGLLLMDDTTTPAHLRDVIPPRQQLQEIAKRFGLSMSELTLRAMLSRADIASLVVGIETVAQIKENLSLFAKGALPPEVLAALTDFAPKLPEFIVSPADWEKAKAEFEKKSAIRPPA